MGNYRFRLSDMIPNSWFYKLRDNKIKKQQHVQSSSSSLSSSAPPPQNSQQITKLPHLSDQRKSYYFTREITFHPAPISPTKTTTTPIPIPIPDSDNKNDFIPPRKSSRRPRTAARRRNRHSPTKSSSDDNDSSCTKCQTGNDLVIINDLPPIITKKLEHGNQPPPPTPTPTPSASSPGVKLRTNTPKIANRRINQGRKSAAAAAGGGGGARRSMSSESFAVVKKSRDPGRDFRESMVEMIVENNIRASKDLEELLACYLSLNSDEYHELIINVFKQIWFDFIRFRLKS